MPLFRRRKREKANPQGQSPYVQWMLGRVSADSTSGQAVTTRTALSMATVYRCVSLISDVIIGAPRRIVQIGDDGSRTVDHSSAVAEALAEATWDDLELGTFGFLADGNGFLRLRQRSDASLWIEGLPSWSVGVELQGDGSLRYRYHDRVGHEHVLDARELAHLRYRSISRSVLGESPLETCAESIGLALAVRSFSSVFMRSSGFGTWALKTDRRIEPGAAKRLRESFEGAMRVGQEQRPRAILLEDGLSVEDLQTGRSASDAQLIDAHTSMTRELSRIYGVPIGWLAHPADRGATAIEDVRQLVAGVRPTVLRFAEGLSRLLLSAEQRAAGWRVELDLTQLLLGSGVEAADYASKLANAGLATVNEARRGLGLSPIAGGDFLRAPVNTMPVEAWARGDSVPGGGL